MTDLRCYQRESSRFEQLSLKDLLEARDQFLILLTFDEICDDNFDRDSRDLIGFKSLAPALRTFETALRRV